MISLFEFAHAAREAPLGMVDFDLGMVDLGSGMVDFGLGMVDFGLGMMDFGLGLVDFEVWFQQSFYMVAWHLIARITRSLNFFLRKEPLS